MRGEGLRKRLGDVRAVDGVELQVEEGELLVLLGQNGAGKSTTLRCLGGILRPDAGVIDLDGLRLPEKLDEVRARLGVVPDQARLYGRNTAPEYLDHFGYLYRVPDWIFCDEPTAGLDPVAAADMRRYLGEQRSRGAALIVTTHVLSEAELMADRIAIMRRGLVVTHGPLDELRREAETGKRFSVRLSQTPSDPAALPTWLREKTVGNATNSAGVTDSLTGHAAVAERPPFAAELQSRLAALDAPYY